jgi:hypothetical protein
MEQSKSISLNVFHPEYTTRFFFRIINTICELPEHHTPKELENNIRFLKTLDLIAFQNLVNRVANKEQLKDILKARFESYKGNKQEWLEYTKNNVKLLKRENIIQWDGLVNLWNDWFKEMEILHNKENEAPPPKTLKEFIVAEYALTYIFDLFSNGQQIPTNRTEGGLDKKQIESQSSYYNCPKKPDTFYREVKRIIKYDINKNTYLQSISKDWRFAVLTLTKERNRLEQYLKDKELI